MYSKHIPRWKGFPPAEYRLYGAMVGGPALVVGAFWLGWTGEYSSVHWAAPGVATIVLGYAISLIFMSFMTYLVDTYLMYSASAFSANTTVRSLVAAAFPLFTVQMYTKLGINWASTLVGFIGLLLAPSPFLFYKYGARIRQMSKFAPCIDLKIAKELKEEDEERERERLERKEQV
jgi:MFS transporter, DHA1 family, multidrug resistance protein